MEIGSSEWKQLIIDGARHLEIALQEATVGLFAAHARELLKWNRKINLTAITDPLEMAVKHYLDSIAPIRFFARPANLLDIGSGGGFPGIPLKIVMPDLPVTLIDANRKKVGFLNHAGRLLGLERFQAVHTRAEDLARRSIHPTDRHSADSGTSPGRLPASFSLIVTRALVSLDDFLALGLPILAAGGTMVVFKGKLSEEEIDADRIARAGLSSSVHRYELPFLHLKRSVVILESGCGHPDRVAG